MSQRETGLEILRADELASKFPTMREPVVDGVLRKGEICNIVCAPKMKKSWLVIDLALSVARGAKWLDQFETTQANVLLVDMECHRETLADRLRHVARSHGEEGSLRRVSTLSLRGFSAPLGIRKLREMLLGQFAAESWGLIILDPGYQLLESGTDENSNMQIRDFYRELDILARHFNCGIVLVHHSSKGNQSFKEVTDCGSGAGSQSRACDAHLVMRKHSQKDCCVIQGVLRSFEEFLPFTLRWEFPQWKKDERIDPRLQHRATPVGQTEGEIDEKVLQTIRQKNDSQTGVARRTKIKDDKIKSSITRLLERGQIKQCVIKKANRNWDGYCSVV